MSPQAVSIYRPKHKHDIVGSSRRLLLSRFCFRLFSFLQGYYNWERTRRSPRSMKQWPGLKLIRLAERQNQPIQLPPRFTR